MAKQTKTEQPQATAAQLRERRPFIEDMLERQYEVMIAQARRALISDMDNLARQSARALEQLREQDGKGIEGAPHMAYAAGDMLSYARQIAEAQHKLAAMEDALQSIRSYRRMLGDLDGAIAEADAREASQIRILREVTN